jgi:hypothetical protein
VRVFKSGGARKSVAVQPSAQQGAGVKVLSTPEKYTTVEMQRVSIIQNKTSYEVGDTCELLLTVPPTWIKGVGRCVVGDSGCEIQHRDIHFEEDERDVVVSFTVTEKWLPSVAVQCAVIGEQVRANGDEVLARKDRSHLIPSVASAFVALKVSPEGNRLHCEIRMKNPCIKPRS